MDWAALLYLGITFILLVIFLVIAVRTYSKRNRSRLEEAKHRMLDDD
jgi:cbb3-type cytochrome oxidase subunit 3